MNYKYIFCTRALIGAHKLSMLYRIKEVVHSLGHLLPLPAYATRKSGDNTTRSQNKIHGTNGVA